MISVVQLAQLPIKERIPTKTPTKGPKKNQKNNPLFLFMRLEEQRKDAARTKNQGLSAAKAQATQ